MYENDDCGIVHDEQRVIWSTWKLTMHTLGDDSCRILDFIALCASRPIVSKLTRKVVDEIRDEAIPIEVAYSNLVKGEFGRQGVITSHSEG